MPQQSAIGCIVSHKSHLEEISIPSHIGTFRASLSKGHAPKALLSGPYNLSRALKTVHDPGEMPNACNPIAKG